MKCRFCNSSVKLQFVDLVNAPPSNSYLSERQLDEPETFYPLKVLVCENCWLVQVDEYKKSSEIFDSSYAYFASYSSSWLEHSRAYVAMAAERFGLDADSFVVEIASNDGYLLQYVRERGIPCLGVEPTASTAGAARDIGVPTVEEFFGADYANRMVHKHGQADLMIANNVLAHVPDINDFVEGFRITLKPGGNATVEFPHVLNLIRKNQFDTVYHEHFSYLSMTACRAIFTAHGLTVYDVEEIPTHGGSLRLFVRHDENKDLPVREAVDVMEQREIGAGLRTREGYTTLQAATNAIRADVLRFLYDCRDAGRTVVAYGAAAKGNTLLNYCGIKGTELIACVVDRSPHKQGMFLPGSHIPIVGEERLRDLRPDVIVILPWNLSDEISAQLAYARDWGAVFVTFVPRCEVF